MDDQGTVVVSQGNNVPHIESVVSVSAAETGQTNQVVTTASGQTITVPTVGGGVSIVHVALPNQQPVQVQSVIQPNQQSVIQTTSGASALQAVQLATLSDLEESAAAAEEENKKRREILARRPSYRKILNDLSSADTPVIPTDVKEETSSISESSSQEANETANTIAIVPAGAIQIATGSQGEAIQGLQTLTMTNAGAGAAGTIVQYAQGQDGQYFVPVTVSAADLQAYQIRTSGGGAGSLSQGVVVAAQTASIQSPQQLAEEASRKRELRLLKNREAARECRRKKKEYIKCLENRVAVLENQNKALIEELKSLKELYCQKND